MFDSADMFVWADTLLNTIWEGVSCPICLEFPHNCVLLQCSSYDKGCRPFVCDTGYLLSNCLDRLKNAYGVPSLSLSDNTTTRSSHSKTVENKCKMACPLCRGKVIGWVVIDEARLHLDKKQRCCPEENCGFSGTYFELSKHAHLEHPHSCPSKIDPTRKRDWESFQRQQEISEILGTIFSEFPQGVVMGDYVIEDEDEQEDPFIDDEADDGQEDPIMDDEAEDEQEDLPMDDEAKDEQEDLPMDDEAKDEQEDLPMDDEAKDEQEDLPMDDEAKDEQEDLPRDDEDQ